MDPVAPFAIAVMTLAGGAFVLTWAAEKTRRAAPPVRVRAQRVQAQRRRPADRG